MAKATCSQNQRVLQYMKDHGSISTMEAFADLGVTRLSARIKDLRTEGHEIEAKQEVSKNRYGRAVNYCLYRLGA